MISTADPTIAAGESRQRVTSRRSYAGAYELVAGSRATPPTGRPSGSAPEGPARERVGAYPSRQGGALGDPLDYKADPLTGYRGTTPPY